MRATIVILSASFALSACQTVSDVMPIGRDTYLVGATVRGGLTSDAEVTALSIKRGTEFCAGQGKRFELATATNSGTQGWTPQQSQVQFKCI